MELTGYWVYMLLCKNNSFYTGYTNNLEKRLKSHSMGNASCKYTRSFKPISLAQCWHIKGDRTLAMRMEKEIKKLSHSAKIELTSKPKKFSINPKITLLSKIILNRYKKCILKTNKTYKIHPYNMKFLRKSDMKFKMLFLIYFLTSSTLFAKESMLISDFQKPRGEWIEIKSKDHHGEQKLLKITENAKNQIYLYWMGPNAETTIQKHATYEEVIIAQGTLYWMSKNKRILKKLEVGAYVDRKPNIDHGPFKAGPDGCLMYVRFHT